jgi:hypothetical protein
MSFPDPHHPWDPPASELGRIDWHDVPLPAGYIEDRDRREAVLDGKPRHWRAWYDGRLVSNYEAPASWVPATMTADQVREVNARNAVECELIDEAIGRVLATIAARGWADDVDVIFTTDHGELQGDFGLLFKGPYHVDGLMRIPLIWRPAPSTGSATAFHHPARRPGRSGPDLLHDRRRPVPDWMEGGTAGRRCRRRTAGLRAGADRVGQRAVRRRRAPSARSPATVGVHDVPAGSATTAARASCTTSSTIRCSRSIDGTTRRWRHCAATYSPTCGITNRRCIHRCDASRRRW